MAEDKVKVTKRGNHESEASAEEKASALVDAQDEEVFGDKSLKGSINMAEVVDIQLSLKTAVSVSGAKEYAKKTTAAAGDGAGAGAAAVLDGAELAEDMVVFKVTSRKMRRYVLACPYEQVVPMMVSLARHVHFARASLRFRREFGSGVHQSLTLAERIQWAASTHGAKVALALVMVAWQNKFLREKVLGFELYSIGPVKITPGRIITAFVVTKTARDVYIRSKVKGREQRAPCLCEERERGRGRRFVLLPMHVYPFFFQTGRFLSCPSHVFFSIHCN